MAGFRLHISIFKNLQRYYCPKFQMTDICRPPGEISFNLLPLTAFRIWLQIWMLCKSSWIRIAVRMTKQSLVMSKPAFPAPSYLVTELYAQRKSRLWSYWLNWLGRELIKHLLLGLRKSHSSIAHSSPRSLSLGRPPICSNLAIHTSAWGAIWLI